MPQRTKPGVDWAEIEDRYRSGETSYELGQAFDVKRQSIDKRASKEGWTHEERKSDGKDLEKVDWLSLAQQTQTGRALESPQTLGEKFIAAMGVRTPETMTRILEAISSGVSPTLATQAQGFSPALLTKWRDSDPDFNDLIRAARSVFLSGQQVNIADASDRGDWKAAQAILQAAPETRKDWASNHSGGTGITVNISISGEDSPPTVDITPTPEDK